MKKFAMAALVLALAGGCAKKGEVVEKTPVADLGPYAQTAVAVDVPTTIKNSAQAQQTLTNALVERLRKKGFDVVATDAATMIIKVHVSEVDGGNSGAAALGGSAGEAKATMSVDLVAQKENKSLGSFDVSGNSKKDMNTSIGGVNTSAMEDRSGRALEAAADQIAETLAAHRGAKAN